MNLMEIKQLLENKKAENERIRGQLDACKKNLKELIGTDIMKEAENILGSMETEAEEMEAELESMTEALVRDMKKAGLIKDE